MDLFPPGGGILGGGGVSTVCGGPHLFGQAAGIGYLGGEFVQMVRGLRFGGGF
jgi:hypothetical protein